MRYAYTMQKESVALTCGAVQAVTGILCTVIALLLYFGITPEWFGRHMTEYTVPLWWLSIPLFIGSATTFYAWHILRKHRIQTEKASVAPASVPTEPRTIPPTEPILVFEGPSNTSGEEFSVGPPGEEGRAYHPLHDLVFSNQQFSTETVAYNVEATLKYFHLGEHRFTDKGLWWVRDEPSGFKPSVSIPTGRKARLLIVGQWPPGSSEQDVHAISEREHKKLSRGTWKVEISITRDGQKCMEGTATIEMLPNFRMGASFHAANPPSVSPPVKATIT